MKEEKKYLFFVTDKDLKIEYPELARIKEFKSLNSKELKFVWYHSNRTSPFYKVVQSERDKILLCIKEAFKVDVRGELESYLNKYISGNFPSTVKVAMERMERFRPSERLRAKISTEKVFSNMEESLIISSELEEAMKTDIELRKKYVELSIKVAQEMPGIVEQMEQGFGISSIESYRKQDKGPTLMDTLHTEDK